jgi:hypothetical protein
LLDVHDTVALEEVIDPPVGPVLMVGIVNEPVLAAVPVRDDPTALT